MHKRKIGTFQNRFLIANANLGNNMLQTNPDETTKIGNDWLDENIVRLLRNGWSGRVKGKTLCFSSNYNESLKKGLGTAHGGYRKSRRETERIISSSPTPVMYINTTGPWESFWKHSLSSLDWIQEQLFPSLSFQLKSVQTLLSTPLRSCQMFSSLPWLKSGTPVRRSEGPQGPVRVDDGLCWRPETGATPLY